MKLRNILLTTLTAGALIGGSLQTNAQVTVDVNPGSTWLGWLNWTDIRANGWDGGSGWGVPDLTATFVGNPGTLTLGPNTIGDAADYWYIGGGGPGAQGAKIMEANLYVEETGTLNGQTVTFEGTVLSDTFTSAHSTRVFVSDFAPDYSSRVDSFFDITGPGAFSVSLATINDPGRHIQYGFQTRGENVWVTDVAPFGTVVIQTVPEPTTFALVGLGAAVLLITRRRS